MATETTDRNNKMKDLRLQGATLEEIAKEFQITRERVRQCINSVLEEGDEEAIRSAVQIRRARRKAREILESGNPARYRTLSDLASKVGTTPEGLSPESSDLMDARHDLVHYLLRDSPRKSEGDGIAFSREDILDALRGAAERAGLDTLSMGPGGTYVKHRREGDPSHQIIALRFGSWNKALEAAGLSHNHRSSKPLRWSAEQVVESAVTFLQEEGLEASSFKYDEWAAQRGDTPGIHVVRRSMSGWHAARMEVIRRGLSQGDHTVLVLGERWDRESFPREVVREARS